MRTHQVKISCFASAIAVILGIAPAAQAVPVSYSESVSGDLAQTNPLSVFVFDVGPNTVSGNFGVPATGPSDFDSFAFTIPVGTELLAGQVLVADAMGNVVASTWFLRSGSLALSGGSLVEFLSAPSPGSDVLSTTPLGAGDYNVSHFSFASSGPNPNTADYVFTFTLRSLTPTGVPEPVSLALLGIAFGALGWSYRRKSA